MIRVMEPDEWCGVGDLARALDEPRSSRAKMRQVLLARGLVTAPGTLRGAADPVANHGWSTAGARVALPADRQGRGLSRELGEQFNGAKHSDFS
jgi:hypothetical protein